ncbi:MAG: F0F1 ATP synthase subunit epsilon [Pyrinomonadaceae bacterium]
MAEQLQLEIVTPERRVLAEEVEAVQLPGANGELGILPGHTPLISQLQTGVLAYTQGGASHQLHVSGGFVEVNADRVSVLAEIAERPEEIDAAQARIERDEAEKILNAADTSEEDSMALREKLERATVRLQLTSGATTR